MTISDLPLPSGAKINAGVAMLDFDADGYEHEPGPPTWDEITDAEWMELDTYDTLPWTEPGSDTITRRAA